MCRTIPPEKNRPPKKTKKLTIKIFPLSQWDDLVDRYERDAVVSVHGLVYIYGQCGVGVGEVGVWGGRTSGDPLISPQHASPGRMRQTIHFKVTDTAYIAHTPSIAFRHPAPRKEGCRKAMLGVCIHCLGGGQSGRGGNGVGRRTAIIFPVS